MKEYSSSTVAKCTMSAYSQSAYSYFSSEAFSCYWWLDIIWGIDFDWQCNDIFEEYALYYAISHRLEELI